MRTRRWTALVAGVALIVAAGCSSTSETEASGSSGSLGTATDGTTAGTTASMAEPTALEITATDFAYELDAAEVPAGPITITLDNQGAEEHQATIIEFRDGKTMADLVTAAESDPAGLTDIVATFGGPNGVAGGASLVDTVDLAEGSYTIICFIPSPTDGVAHAAKGMVTTLEVGPATDEASMPEADEEVTLVDYNFDLPDDFTGAGSVKVVNDGEQYHELTAYKLDDGATVDDAMAVFSAPPGSAPPAGPPPFSPAGGVSAMDVGEENVVDLDLEPGNYVFLCFLPDVEDGLPHFLHGMVLPVTIE